MEIERPCYTYRRRTAGGCGEVGWYGICHVTIIVWLACLKPLLACQDHRLTGGMVRRVADGLVFSLPRYLWIQHPTFTLHRAFYPLACGAVNPCNGSCGRRLGSKICLNINLRGDQPEPTNNCLRTPPIPVSVLRDSETPRLHLQMRLRQIHHSRCRKKTCNPDGWRAHPNASYSTVEVTWRHLMV